MNALAVGGTMQEDGRQTKVGVPVTTVTLADPAFTKLMSPVAPVVAGVVAFDAPEPVKR